MRLLICLLALFVSSTGCLPEKCSAGEPAIRVMKSAVGAQIPFEENEEVRALRALQGGFGIQMAVFSENISAGFGQRIDINTEVVHEGQGIGEWSETLPLECAEDGSGAGTPTMMAGLMPSFDELLEMVGERVELRVSLEDDPSANDSVVLTLGEL